MIQIDPDLFVKSIWRVHRIELTINASDLALSILSDLNAISFRVATGTTSRDEHKGGATIPEMDRLRHQHVHLVHWFPRRLHVRVLHLILQHLLGFRSK